MLTAFQSESRSSTLGKFRKIIGVELCVLGAFVLIALKVFWMFGLLSVFMGTFLIFFHPSVSLALGIVAIGVVSYLAPNEAVSRWEIFQRGAVFFVGSWLIFVYTIVLIRKILLKEFLKRSISSFIVLSYVERKT